MRRVMYTYITMQHIDYDFYINRYNIAFDVCNDIMYYVKVILRAFIFLS